MIFTVFIFSTFAGTAGVCFTAVCVWLEHGQKASLNEEYDTILMK